VKVFLDEGVPERLVRELAGHDVQSVGQAGWKGTKNGELLRAVEEAGFEAFITNDKNMEAEQRLDRRPFAILILSTCNLRVILPYLSVIQEAVDHCQPGTVQRVECGRFVPRSKRKQSGGQI
jgi:hypothetical protein